VLLVAGVAACAGRGAAPDRQRLAGSLEVQVVGDTVWLGLHVTNTGAAPLELQFSSSQRFDFQVQTLAGETVWSWSADRSFAQVLGSERLEPGATWHEAVQWIATGLRGEHVAVGRLVSLDHPVELTARFELGTE
jgi:hypothetical protein